MALTYPNRNGYLYSFQSTQVQQGAELFKGLLGVKFSPKLEGRKLVMGNGRKAYGRVRGQLMVEGEVTFLADAFFDFQRAHPQILDEVFNPTIINEEGARRDVIELVELVFESLDYTSEGTDEIRITLPFSAIDAKINGEAVVLGDSLGLDNEAGAQ